MWLKRALSTQGNVVGLSPHPVASKQPKSLMGPIAFKHESFEGKGMVLLCALCMLSDVQTEPFNAVLAMHSPVGLWVV